MGTEGLSPFSQEPASGLYPQPDISSPYPHSLTHTQTRARGCIQKFPDWVITKYTLTTINTSWEATQRVIAAKLTRMTHKIAIQLHLVAESFNILQFSL
jgi:hypothetical protein